MDGVLLEIDFENVYDKVQWTFLQEVMRKKGFDPKWCQLVEHFISCGSVGIELNDDICHYFQTQKGLKQGDMLSIILFNLVARMVEI
jgi:mannosylglycoprotein endo-beta-mannosidase